MQLEKIKVITEEGENETWLIPFKWYKKRGCRSYEPLNEVKQELAKLKSWQLASEQFPLI